MNLAIAVWLPGLSLTFDGTDIGSEAHPSYNYGHYPTERHNSANPTHPGRRIVRVGRSLLGPLHARARGKARITL